MPVSRHLCREIILQAIFACEMKQSGACEMKQSGTDENEDADVAECLPSVLAEFYPGMETAPDFLVDLSEGITTNLAKIRKEIGRHAPEWPVNKVNTVDRGILYLGTYEILFEDTPKNVVIDECVELAKKFGTENSPKFVNGVLNALKQSVRG